MIDYRSPMQSILQTVVNIRYAELAEYVFSETLGVVQSGPFRGMKIPREVSWGQGDVIPKLLGLGTYEQELIPAIYKAIRRKPAVVYNVGCAEGYYAVGLARALPEATVAAFDTGVISVCLKAQAMNDVGRRFSTGGEFKSSRINEWNVTPYRSLVVMDVEGAEISLIGGEEDSEADYRYSDLIVECHDFKLASISTWLTERLQDTHDIEFIQQSGRDNTAYTILNKFDDFRRSLALCEWRPCPMQWMVAWSKECKTQ